MSELRVDTSSSGRGLFAAEPIPRGGIIVLLCGNVVHKNDLPMPYEAGEDHYVQISPEHFIGPGDMADYSNHSCEPNAWLRIHDDPAAELVALCDIAAGEEIRWDYSTVMIDDDWTMNCLCETPSCRTVVREFRFLPESTKERYRNLGIIPAYVEEIRPRR